MNQTARKNTVSKGQVAARLAGYSAAAGAILAGAGSAEAKIVYSGPQNILVVPDAGLVPVKVQGSVVDISFSAWLGGGQTRGTMTMYGRNGFQVIANSIGSKFPLFFGAGDVIPPATATPIYPGYFSWNDSARLGWAPYSPRFLAMRFEIEGGGPVYGWIQIANQAEGKPDNDLPWTIVDWAYEDSGAPILAGDTGMIPEPSTLATLALGATGVLAMRRRGKKRTEGGRTKTEDRSTL